MKRSFLLLMVVFSPPGLAANKAWAPWPIAELRSRFQVTSETFVLDATGHRVWLQNGSRHVWRTNDDKGVLHSDWTGEENGEILAFRHQWQVQDDSSIKVHIEQYAHIKYGKSREDGPELVDLIKQEDKVLENLEPITWVASSNAERRIVVRFTPGFSDEDMPKQASFVPISGTDVAITDSQGNVWARHVFTEGKYAGFTTVRGALYLSFYPFAGAHEIGKAGGREIEVRIGPQRWVTLASAEPFLPAGMQLKVFGIVREGHRTRRLNSVGVSNTTEEAEFVKGIPGE